VPANLESQEMYYHDATTAGAQFCHQGRTEADSLSSGKKEITFPPACVACHQTQGRKARSSNWQGGFEMAAKRAVQASLSAAVLLFFAGAAPVFAWTSYGHMLIAYLAYQKLTPATRERACQLLRLNPYYESWKKEAGRVRSDDELKMKIFMLAATWPDVLKGDSSYKVDGSMAGFRPSGPLSGQNTGYDDKQTHMYWHFCDEPFASDKSSLPPIPTPNSLTQMKAFRKVLSSDAPDELKSYDLTWLIHLVGDMHQPLHGVTRISKLNADGDSGGNLVKIKCPGCPANLHTFWDLALGGSGDPKILPDPQTVIESASRLSDTRQKAGEDLNLDDWVKETARLARNSVYKPLGKGNGPYALSQEYRRKANKLAEHQGELAAQRLANLLNRELK
jgi:hypothetical protein